MFPVFLITVIIFPCFHCEGLQSSSDNYDIIFQDNFNLDGLPTTSRWNRANINYSQQGELECYQPGNVFVKNGSLHLRAQPYPGCENKDFKRPYSSGYIDTREKFDFLYGEVEWQARVPKGQGLWASLILKSSECAPVAQCDDWPPSVSALDAKGGEVNLSFVRVFWKMPPSSDPWSEEKEVTNQEDMSLKFHLYKVVWLPNRLSWYIDDKEVYNVTEIEKIPSVRMQVVMNLAVGGNFSGPPNSNTKFPSDFMISHITVRQAKTSWPWWRLLVPLGATLLFVMFSVGVFCFIRRKKKLAKQDQPILESDWIIVQRSDFHDVMIDPHFRFLEIPVARLKKTSELLGKGQFGSVWKGLLKDENDPEHNPAMLVAIKTFMDHPDHEEELQRELFLEEMKIMTKVGRHLNIINLLGTVTIGQPLLIVLEFCPHGALLKYLQLKRSSFVNNVGKDGNLIDPKIHIQDETGNNNYILPIQLIPQLHLNQPSQSDSQLDTGDLIHITYQVTRGLEYLAARSVIHRDLAARNILVCENNIVKISDFGLAREFQLSEYVLQKNQVALPIKWMAPESILEMNFSHKSDVWALGILMWEIFSLGESPFCAKDEIKLFKNTVLGFAQAVSRGLRMSRPRFAPNFIYEIMLRCWNLDKEARPTASVLQVELFNHIGNLSAHFLKHLDEPFQQFNVLYAAILAETSLNTDYSIKDSTDSDTNLIDL